MWNTVLANLTSDFIKRRLHHGHVIAECFDFFFGKTISQNSLLVSGAYLFSEPNQILIVLIELRKGNPRNRDIHRKLF